MSKLTLILGIACAVFLALWLRSCQSTPLDTTIADRKVDSINTVLKVHDSAHIRVIDSAAKVIVKERRRGDSLEHGMSLIKGSLKGKDKDIAGLVERINEAEQAKDTAAIMAGCDSLKMTYPIAKGLVTEYIMRNDSLMAVNHAIISEKDTIVAHLNAMGTEANASLFEISRQFGNVSAQLKTEIKKSAKRFGIGPQITLTYIDGRVTVAPGIGITYSFIRF